MNAPVREEFDETKPAKEINETVNAETQVEEKINPDPIPLSKTLEEIVGFMHTVNQRLEDLSLTRRTQISQKQWTTLEEFKASPKTAVKPVKFWQKVLFARTYFVDKDLDDSFQNVVKYSSLFYNHLNNFNAKIQCRGDGAMEECAENAADHQRSTAPPVSQSTASPQQPVTSESLVKTSKSKTTKTAVMSVDETNYRSDEMKDVRQSFVDLIRAKIEFDSQFLNFNTVLSKNCYSDDFHSLYEICTNSNIVLGQTSLSIDKRGSFGSDNKRLRRKRLSGSVMEKSQRKKLRSSTRAAPEEDSAEIQVIRSFSHRKTA